MTPERWEEIGKIFHAALQIDLAERPAFLTRACSGDQILRQEVESLIEAHEKEGSFINSVLVGQMADAILRKQEFTPRQKVGHYEILDILGKGGMGEVYLAQDDKLGRRVALKFLPIAFTQHHERLRRFEQEARTASALNHPNILTIHEIGEAEARRFIATEFVDGETLRDRLSSRPMDIPESLEVSEQIASALAAAQTEGIIHRDIKPENIMLRRDGIVKVLDFGLAKLAEDKVHGPDDPTRALIKTGAGVVMGTAQYMSPEQARGLEVDTRTDIFSLGVVIYEMVSGRQPFKGETASDVIASILKTDPAPLSRVAAGVPAELERIVTKALEKDRDERYQTVKDLLLDLRKHRQRISFEAEQARSQQGTAAEGATTNVDLVPTNTAEPANTATVPPARTVSSAEYIVSELKRHKTGVVFAIAGLIIASIAGLVALYKFINRIQPQAVQAPQVLKTTQLTFSNGLDAFPSLAPDGNSIAYSSDQSGNFEIYVKQLTPGGRELQLTSDGQQNVGPAWSPDGQRIAFHSKGRGGIWIMPALGGSARQITEFGSSPGWSRDGLMLAFQSGVGGEIGTSRALAPSTIWTVSTRGGTPTQITQSGNPPGGHNSPAWSPDGKHVVFVSSEYLGSSIWTVANNGSDLRKVSQGENPKYAPDGKSIYLLELSGLSAVSLSVTGEPIGTPTQIIPAGTGASLNQFTISADGKKIAYGATRNTSGLWSIPMSPPTGETSGSPVAFTRDTSSRSSSPQFSKDGRKLAMTKWREGSVDIWIADADGGNLTQLTTHPSRNSNASWFPDADRLAFLSDRENHRSELWGISRATGKEERLLDVGDSVDFAALSPDGLQVAFNSTKAGTINLWTAKVPDGEPKQLTFDKELMGFPCWSPDGQWLAFEIKRGDDNYLAIMPSAGGEVIQLVSDHGFSWPHSWSADGDKIAFAGRRNGVWNVYWVSRSTRQQKRLTNYSKLNAFVRYPAWSPLGNQIVYEYNETMGNIWLMELK